jgi:hypothetical protein
MKLGKVWIVVLVWMGATDLMAQAWTDVLSNDYGRYQFDPFSVVGPNNDRKIITRVNFLKERPDKFKSMVVHYSIDCTNNTSLRELIKGYSESNLSGIETNVPINLQKREEIKPNLLTSHYSGVVCSGSKLATVSGERSNLLANSPPPTVASSNNSVPSMQGGRWLYFTKINPEKNLQQAFEGVMTDDQRLEVSWGFIFANNVILKITQGQNYTSFADAYLKFLPVMKEGLGKYYSSFDRMATSLGVSRASIMKEFGISVNERGLADFTQSRNTDIESQMNSYIWFFAIETKACGWIDTECQRNEQLKRREIAELQRTLRPYYLGMPPNLLYGSKVNEDISKIEALYQAVLKNANRIEGQLVAQENERQRQENEAAIRREAERQRLAELNRQRAEDERRRQEFLKSSAGQKQIAEEREAERRRQAQFAKDFPYYAEITCNNGGYGNFQIHACFTNGQRVLFELHNGAEYKFYTLPDIMELAANSVGDNESIINLRGNFQIRMQNTGGQWILGLRIINRETRAVAFEKKVSGFGVISVKN